MRYLFAVADFPPRVGGAARYHAAVARALGDAVVVHRVTLDRSWLHLPWALARAARAHRADALLIGEVLPVGTAVAILHAIRRMPYAVICHGLDLRNALGAPRKRWLVHWILRHADRVIVNSAFTRALAADAGARPEHTHVVHPPIGITPALALPAHVPDVRAQPDLARARIILSVGRLVPRKGFDTLIRAMAIVRRTHALAVLAIIGDGPDRERLEAIAREERLAVRFLGALDDATTAAWYAACDVFALLPRELSSGDVEGFGIVYLEAGAFGKPVVGTRSGGVPDAVADGETGILVPPNDPAAAARAITELLSDPPRARTLGERGRARAEFSFSASAFRERFRAALGVAPDATETPPHISIVIPIYGSPDPLRACLASLAAQTHQNFDVVVVDDGSTPPLRGEFQISNFKFQIRFLRQPHAGAPAARNRGARETTGELLLFLDADVVLAPHALARMGEALRAHPEASFAYSAFRFGRKTFRCFPFDPERLRRMPYIHTTSLIRRVHFPGFDESLKRFQDWDLWLTMLERGCVGVRIPEVLFTVRSGGTMSRWMPSFAYRLPWKPARIRAYEDAAAVIRAKHRLPAAHDHRPLAHPARMG